MSLLTILAPWLLLAGPVAPIESAGLPTQVTSQDLETESPFWTILSADLIVVVDVVDLRAATSRRSSGFPPPFARHVARARVHETWKGETLEDVKFAHQSHSGFFHSCGGPGCPYPHEPPMTLAAGDRVLLLLHSGTGLTPVPDWADGVPFSCPYPNGAQRLEGTAWQDWRTGVKLAVEGQRRLKGVAPGDERWLASHVTELRSWALGVLSLPTFRAPARAALGLPTAD